MKQRRKRLENYAQNKTTIKQLHKEISKSKAIRKDIRDNMVEISRVIEDNISIKALWRNLRLGKKDMQAKKQP